MMQHGWRGGPPMRGGGMRGRGGGGGFNSGGFRGRGGGTGVAGGAGRPPRTDRSRSPIRGKPSALGEPAEWEMRTDVILDFYNSDLNLRIDDSGLSATPLHNEGFAFMWGGARATYGIRSPIGKEGYPTQVCFEVRVGDKLPVSHLPPEESNPHVLRVGWSTDDTTFALGEEIRSWGYGGTAKKSVNCKFENYGTSYSVGDVVTAFLDIDQTGNVRMSYSVNGLTQGDAFRTHVREIGDRAFFPHVYTKNLPFEINFGQLENPWFPLPENQQWQFIGDVPVEKRIRGLCPPQKIEDCEMLMMCGLPGAGKTYWAEKHYQNSPEKRYTVLGTNNILDKMKVMGLPRKRNYSGRWDVLIELSTKCLNKLFEIASRRKRNYILDQTNVYPNAQRRKMRPFESFHRKAVVVVPTDDEFKRRIVQRTKEEGKEVPESAVLEMKANFRLPSENDLFEEIMFTELDRTGTEALVKQYNEEAMKWKRSGGSIAPSSVNNRTDDSSGAKFRPDRNYGRSSGGGAGTTTMDDLSSVSSFGLPSRSDSESDRGARGRGDWRGGGGSRGGFRGGFNNDGNKPDSGRDNRGGLGASRGGGVDQDRSRRGVFENRRGGFQRDGGSRFSDSESFGGNRGGFVGGRSGFGGMQSGEGDGFQSDNRFQGGHGFQDRVLDQQEQGGTIQQPGFGQDRNFGDRQGFGSRGRSGFDQDPSSGQEDMYRQDQSNRPGMDSDSGYGGRGEGFHEQRGGNFGNRGRGGSSFGNRGPESGGYGDRGGFGDRMEGGIPSTGGFGGDRGGRFGDRGRPGDRGGRGRGGFGDRGGRFGGDRGPGREFGSNRDFSQGIGEDQGAGGYRRGGFSDRSNTGFGDGSGGADFDTSGYGGDRGRAFGGNERGAGFAGNDRNTGGYGGNERGGGYGDNERDSSGYGGSDRSGGYGGNRGGVMGSNDRSSGYGGDHSGFRDNERGGGYGGTDRSGGFGGDRRGYGGNRGFSDDRNPGGYGGDTTMDPMSTGRRPKMSRWSDAQPEEQASSQPAIPDSNPMEGSMSRSGGQQISKGMGYGGYSGRSMQGGDMGYDDGSRHCSDQYGGRQPQAMTGGRTGFSQPSHNTGSGYGDSHQSGYDTSNRSTSYQGYGQSGYQSQSNVASQESAGGYNYGQESSTTSGYGSYSQPPPQVPQPEVSSYQGYSGGNNYWQQQPPPTDQQQQPQQQQQQPWQTSAPPMQQPQQQSWQQWQQPPPTSQQQNQPSTSTDQWSYYQQPPPQDWQQQSGYQ